MKTSNGGIRMKNPCQKRKIIYDILFVIALTVFCFPSYKLISIYYLNYQEEGKGCGTGGCQFPKIRKRISMIDWKALKEKNPDIVGWILILIQIYPIPSCRK